MIRDKRKWITILIILSIFLMRIPGINNAPPEVGDMWRQPDTESIASNFLNYEFNILKPQFNYDGPLPNYIQLEFQITTFIIAILYKVFGQHYFLARLVPIVFFMISVYYLYKISQKIYGIEIAWITIIIYGILPLNLFYSRAIMPESAALCFFNGAFYYFYIFDSQSETFYSYYESSRRTSSLFLSAIFTALAISQKTPTIFIGLAFLFMSIEKYGLYFIKQAKLWIFAIISLFPPFLYILYSGHIAEFKFVEGIGNKHILPKFLSAIFTPEAIDFYKANLAESFTIIILVLGTIGLLTVILTSLSVIPSKDKESPILYWLIAMILEVIFIVSVIKFKYYLIFLTPIISILAARALYLISSRFRYIGRVIVVIILIYTAYNSFIMVKDQMVVRQDIVDFGRVVDEYTKEGDLIVVGHFDPSRLSISNRQGWRANIGLYDHIPKGVEEQIQYYIENGADYFILDENGIYNDDGSMKKYLDDNFMMEIVEGEYRFYHLGTKKGT